jgi:hypothetical protein
MAILNCVGCGRGGLRVPDGRRGKVTCPTCGAEWFYPEVVEVSEVEFRCSSSGARLSSCWQGDLLSISSSFKGSRMRRHVLGRMMREVRAHPRRIRYPRRRCPAPSFSREALAGTYRRFKG